MTQPEADAYMEQVKQNLAKILSVSKDDMLKAEAAERDAKTKAAKRRQSKKVSD